MFYKADGANISNGEPLAGVFSSFFCDLLVSEDQLDERFCFRCLTLASSWMLDRISIVCRRCGGFKLVSSKGTFKLFVESTHNGRRVVLWEEETILNFQRLEQEAAS